MTEETPMISQWSLRLACIITVGLLASCGGGRVAAPDTQGILAAQSGSAEVGPVEEEARSYVEAMTELLQRNAADPEAAVEDLAAFVTDNGEAMRANAEALQARLQSLTGSARRAYEQRLSEFFADATFAWVDAHDAFVEAFPEREDALEQAYTLPPAGQ